MMAPADLQRSAGAESPCANVSVVVVNWNGWRNTIECLESLVRLEYPAYEVVVVDNGSSDGSGDRIWAWARGDVAVDSPYVASGTARAPVTFRRMRVDLATRSQTPPDGGSAVRPFTRGVFLLEAGENLGFTGGNNIGIRYALARGADFVFLLNNDAVADAAVLDQVVARARAPGVGMVAPTVVEYADPSRIDRQGIVLTRGALAYERKGDQDGPLLCPDGCAALYSRSLLEAVASDGQYFDEDLFCYGEDVDLGIRAWRKGFRAALAGPALVYHKGGASLGGLDSAPSLYFRHRNTLWVVFKDLPTRFLVRNALWIVAAQVGTLARALTGAGRGVVVRAKLDGLRGIGAALAKRRRFSGGAGEDLPVDPRLFLPRRRRPQAIHRAPHPA